MINSTLSISDYVQLQIRRENYKQVVKTSRSGSQSFVKDISLCLKGKWEK